MDTRPNKPPFLSKGTSFSEHAPAKINLDLHVVGRRADGYHLLDSLVVFADYGDRLDFVPGDELSLIIHGPYGQDLTVEEDNLVLRAARAFMDRSGRKLTGCFRLIKNLPVASGIGGGSADAAAVLRIAEKCYPGALSLEAMRELALKLGADVPACLMGRCLRMEGIGERITPLPLSFPLYLVLVNPGRAVSTAEIFQERARKRLAFSAARDVPLGFSDFEQLWKVVQNSHNDLQPGASELEPAIPALLDALQAVQGCLLARMSGSGATCFGLFETLEHADAAARKIRDLYPAYWIKTITAR
ncbi:4-(cytidine 5'-diphospho)-2-C-methyl-D-erythritol kinase [Luteithermobacter gelatinilyticus]|uniref:4-(cytidine 5'-diphospho)-2-C-methyl-D-erythritol kinase n=1 Tax=Luteithermobacter gelatinilyticus TaxID=2582913 RepID=UPI0011074EF4|nr:4-(cytidine 5'-diphospho)-2-C-methyl-D-erythritol kinase [Luteithermobacter gelatinilyticus]|tara:strand:- start:14368 stop:15273 length:906 start_codon:yes stop_codon:yes gene_type:complete